MCSAGKRRSQDGCSSVLEQIRGLGYKLFVEFTPTETFTWCDSCERLIIRDIHAKFSELSPSFKLETRIILKENRSVDNGSNLHMLHKISLFAHIVANESLYRDKFESEFLKLVGKDLFLELPGIGNVTLRTALLGFEFKRRLESVQLNKTLDLLRPKDPDENLDAFKTRRENRVSSRFRKRPGQLVLLEETHFLHYQLTNRIPQVWSHEKEFIDMTQSLVCPFVIVNITEIQLEDDTAVFSFMYRGSTINVNDSSKMSLVDDEFHICVDLFSKLIIQNESQKADTITIVQYYFEIVCVSLSVACLLMSFITYCLFRKLRSLPGLNNMSLCMTLAIAQTSLLITVQHGLKGEMHPVYCTIHAVLLHYSWLAAFMWMSVCCVHMFRVFSSLDRHLTEPRLYIKRHIRYAVCAFSTPIVIVLLTITINMSVTHSESNGYDDEICFLDTRKSILTIALTLLTPLCLMILINSILFVLTIRKMWADANSEHLDHSTRETFSVLTYVKLSTLTGIFCIISIVAVQLQNPILNFITSPLMALQGVFIFFSFIVNRRVGKMYFEFLRCHHVTSWWENLSTDRGRSAPASKRNTTDTSI